MNKYQTKAEIDKKAKDQELADLLTLFHETRAEDLKIALAKQREEIIGMIEKKEKGFEAKDMEKYKISVNGCDATTEFEIELASLSNNPDIFMVDALVPAFTEEV